MNMNGRFLHQRHGVTLIMVAGVLAVLAALGTGFFTMTAMQTRSAMRYSDSVRAQFLAKAGIESAIAQLRKQAYEKTESPTDPWFMWDYLNNKQKRISFAAYTGNGKDDDSDGAIDNPEEGASFSGALGNTIGTDSDRYTLEISDAASKININAGDNLAIILDNLCRVIGPPLIAADMDMLQPRRWFIEGAGADYDKNADDTDAKRDIYFQLYNAGGAPAAIGRPKRKSDGSAVYGDGYAIAGYRSLNGRFNNLEDVKAALTYVERNGTTFADHPLEQLEIEVKFAALRPYITLDSWIDINTVCVGKFEWVQNNSGVYDIAIDRDKSWIADDPVNDPKNFRGSLRGSYVSILNGHGSGQFRRIKTNGADWIQLETFTAAGNQVGFTLAPGPISSYMILAREDADPDPYDPTKIAADKLAFAPLGDLKDHPDIDYLRYPLCIHRAPVNVNTASEKVLAALFLGINVQHGHPMAVGTNAVLSRISKFPLPKIYTYSTVASGIDKITNGNPAATEWRAADDVLRLEPYLLTPKGLKRVPADSGKLLLNRPFPWPAAKNGNFAYLGNYSLLGSPGFDAGVVQESGAAGALSEAHELAYRIIVARQRKLDPATGKPTLAADPDVTTADSEKAFAGFEKGPFKSWDDLYFRVVRPWDDIRSYGSLPDPSLPGRSTIPYSGSPGRTSGLAKSSVAKMIMAHFNSNTDILKFNPNIEWINRWGRNFTDMEPVMVFKDTAPDASWQQWWGPKQAAWPKGSYFIRNQRYRSDEMIDKSDLNRSTCEFSFDSGGIYEIESVGQVTKRGAMQAEHKIQALVKVYDVWRESTQRQFALGKISLAAQSNRNTVATGTSSGYTDSGKPVRDAVNVNKHLALDTLPEPLMPLGYRIVDGTGKSRPNVDVVDNSAKDAFGKPKAYDLPDIIANRVMPACYDGQIVLATNTRAWTPNDSNFSDTFLASFNGDLDTGTCLGNGREQAKSPKNPAIRVVDCIGLLGLMNDVEIDMDPENYNIYVIPSTFPAMQGLKETAQAGSSDPVTGAVDGRPAYWNNLSVRMGDLRAEGAYLGMIGTSLKDATVKYLYGDVVAPEFGSGGSGSTYLNYAPDSTTGGTISMWFKSSWHATDSREHEFFNGGSLGDTSNAKYNTIYKAGHFSFSKRYLAGNASEDGSSQFEMNNDLYFGMENNDDDDLLTYLHGGTDGVPVAHLPPNALTKTPSYHVQPFRWSFVGAAFNAHERLPNAGDNVDGVNRAYGWDDNSSTVAVDQWTGSDLDWGYWGPRGMTLTQFVNRDIVTHMGHPFIDSQKHPEGPLWKPDYYRSTWWDFSLSASVDKFGASSGLRGQPAAFKYATSSNASRRQGVFSINNVNENSNSWIYRSTPTDGTYAIIDELKLSKTRWHPDRIAAEQTLSRYYLPDDPASRAKCPTFTSQTLMQSLKGFDKLAPTTDPQWVTLARVSWNVFTPRFMHENKEPKMKRTELVGEYSAGWKILAGSAESIKQMPFKGPFDYCQYNYDVGYDFNTGWKTAAYNAFVPELGVDRVPPKPSEQSHSTRGVEIELLNDTTPLAGFENSGGTFVACTKFHDPDAVNSFRDPANPTLEQRVQTNQLRYRVRFRYPVSASVDPTYAAGGGKRDADGTLLVDPAQHYLLDTPVFDDVSIVYFTRPKILSFREVAE